LSLTEGSVLTLFVLRMLNKVRLLHFPRILCFSLCGDCYLLKQCDRVIALVWWTPHYECSYTHSPSGPERSVTTASWESPKSTVLPHSTFIVRLRLRPWLMSWVAERFDWLLGQPVDWQTAWFLAVRLQWLIRMLFDDAFLSVLWSMQCDGAMIMNGCSCSFRKEVGITYFKVPSGIRLEKPREIIKYCCENSF
jgi:hypothetical protein